MLWSAPARTIQLNHGPIMDLAETRTQDESVINVSLKKKTPSSSPRAERRRVSLAKRCIPESRGEPRPDTHLTSPPQPMKQHPQPACPPSLSHLRTRRDRIPNGSKWRRKVARREMSGTSDEYFPKGRRKCSLLITTSPEARRGRDGFSNLLPFI